MITSCFNCPQVYAQGSPSRTFLLYYEPKLSKIKPLWNMMIKTSLSMEDKKKHFAVASPQPKKGLNE